MTFEVGVDINPTLFYLNPKLQNIQGAFSYCYFDSRDYILNGTTVTSGNHN
jgi:hypothetical protein